MNKEENLKRIDHLKSIALSMPGKPGSYQFYDQDHQIIYVGTVSYTHLRAHETS